MWEKGLQVCSRCEDASDFTLLCLLVPSPFASCSVSPDPQLAWPLPSFSESRRREQALSSPGAPSSGSDLLPMGSTGEPLRFIPRASGRRVLRGQGQESAPVHISCHCSGHFAGTPDNTVHPATLRNAPLLPRPGGRTGAGTESARPAAAEKGRPGPPAYAQPPTKPDPGPAPDQKGTRTPPARLPLGQGSASRGDLDSEQSPIGSSRAQLRAGAGQGDSKEGPLTQHPGPAVGASHDGPWGVGGGGHVPPGHGGQVFLFTPRIQLHQPTKDPMVAGSAAHTQHRMMLGPARGVGDASLPETPAEQVTGGKCPPRGEGTVLESFLGVKCPPEGTRLRTLDFPVWAVISGPGRMLSLIHI